MIQERRRYGNITSVRFRLAAAFLLWTGAFLLCIWWIVPRVRDASVLRAVDGMLLRRVAEVRANIEGAGALGQTPASIAALESARSGDDLYVRVLDPAGVVVAASSNVGESVSLGMPGDPSADPAFHTQQIAGRVGAPARRVRVATARMDDGTGRILQLGMSLQNADQLTDALSRTLLLALAAGTVGAGIAGWIVAGSLVRRLRSVSGAVRAVSPQMLGGRINLPAGSDEIGTMIADLNGMLSRLELAFRSQESFISDVSHELKTPVSALLTEAQVLKYSHPRDEDYERFVVSVEDEMRRLGKLVESFLMLARFGHGRRFIAQGIVHVNDVALESLEHSSLLASHHGITISLNLFDAGDECDEALVNGDFELLRVVVDNLIRNAVQFSKRGDAVQVGIHCADNTVTIAVRDHGPGVPPDHLERIFDRFAQAPAQSGARRGTGLGLTIAKGVVDLHGGTIKAENAVGGGCVFTVALPRARGSEQRAAPKPPPVAAASG